MFNAAAQTHCYCIQQCHVLRKVASIATQRLQMQLINRSDRNFSSSVYVIELHHNL